MSEELLGLGGQAKLKDTEPDYPVTPARGGGPLCPVHENRLGPGAICPVCTTAAHVRALSVLVVALADRLQQVGAFYGSEAASITLEIHRPEIKQARLLNEDRREDARA